MTAGVVEDLVRARALLDRPASPVVHRVTLPPRQAEQARAMGFDPVDVVGLAPALKAGHHAAPQPQRQRPP